MFNWRKDESPDTNDNGVTHWVDGRNVSSLGLAGFLSKKRGTIVSGGFGFVLMGTPWWWPAELPQVVTLSVSNLIVTSAGVLLASFLGLIYYVKKRTRRSLSLKSGLHQLAHEIREAVCDTVERLPNYSKGMSVNDLENEDKHLRAFTKNACTTIGKYFQEIVNDEEVICSIRLASQNPHCTVSDSEYVTYGRAGHYHSGRERNTEPVLRSKGLPAYFLDPGRACQGVLFVYDVAKAEANEVCAKTRNNTVHSEEVKYRAVSPIYGWNGKEMDLLGLLYLTSPNAKILNRVHVDLYRFSADILAASYTTLFTFLQSVDYLAAPEPYETDSKQILTES